MATSTTDRIAGVLLAAGAGSRFEGDDHKLITPFRGRPLAVWALDAALGAGFSRIFVVSGAVDLNPILSQVDPDQADRVHLVDNPRWADGQATSVIAGIEAAAASGAEAVVVGLSDQPDVPASAWRAVGAAAGPIVTATFKDIRRPPVKLDRSVWDDLPRTGDEGARFLFRIRPELVSELPCMGSAFDIDTQEDFQRWN